MNLIMKSLIFTISTMCILLFVSSCKNEISSDCKRLGLNTTVKSVQVKTYEAESKFGEIVRGDLDWDGNYLALFDEKGNLTSITDFDDDGELDSKTVFAYDDRNRLITYTQYDWNGDVDISFEYVYDENYLVKLNQKIFEKVYLTEYKRNGEEIQESINSVDGEIEETAKYIESSLTRASYVVYDNEGKELRTVHEEYDKDGRLLKQIKNTGAETDTTIWIYNKIGYLTEMSTIEYTGEIKYNDKNLPIYIKGGDLYHNTEVALGSWNEDKVYYLEYEYDDKGNWIKQIVYEGEMKKPYTISDRTIVY